MQEMGTLCAWNWCSGTAEEPVTSQMKTLPFSCPATTEEISATRLVTGEGPSIGRVGGHLAPPPVPFQRESTSKRTTRTRSSSWTPSSRESALEGVSGSAPRSTLRVSIFVSDLVSVFVPDLKRSFRLLDGEPCGCSCIPRPVVLITSGSSRTMGLVALTCAPGRAATLLAAGMMGARECAMRFCSTAEVLSGACASQLWLRTSERGAAAMARGGASTARGSESRTSKSMYQFGRTATTLSTSPPGSSRSSSCCQTGSRGWPWPTGVWARATQVTLALSVGT
mmetsp:Transcript_68463/g.200265  ORF Transcript_68463/g.200265 Transcript_68463/m.200265 type:complete len:282 (-) Transcript_68463:470-1315(-)